MAPIVGVLYNSYFDVVVSGDEDGVVRVWQSETGHSIYTFRKVDAVQCLLN